MDIEYQSAPPRPLKTIRARLESEADQKAAAATVQSIQQPNCNPTPTKNRKDGLIPAINLKLSRVRVADLANRYTIEKKRLEGTAKSAQAQLASQSARIAQLKAQLQLRQTQVGTLRVLAGTNGVLQQMQVEVGQQVQPGTNLARVVEPQNLKAELRVAETQAKDISLGQQAMVDTRNGIIPGHVVRIDPASENSTVKVDIALDAALPQGARPDLSVDGTIELERLETFSTSPPRLRPGAEHHRHVQTRTGRAFAIRTSQAGSQFRHTIEILKVTGSDQVILSDPRNGPLQRNLLTWKGYVMSDE